MNQRHYHLIGVCGTAMASLAGMLKAQGHRVTGSDKAFYPPMSDELIKLGIETFEGFDAKNLNLRRMSSLSEMRLRAAMLRLKRC